MGKERKKRTAVHEAGHVVALMAAGLPFSHATIRKGEDSLGHVLHPSVLGINCEARERRRIARDLILCCYAGFEAEQLGFCFATANEQVCGDADPSQASADLSREYGVLPRCCVYIGDDFHDQFLGRLRKESRRLVRKYRQQVEAIADLLLARGKVFRVEVEEIWANQRAR